MIKRAIVIFLVFCLTGLLISSTAKDLTKNLKTFGTMGKEVRPMEKDKEAELFSYQGKGCLTHMWFGGGFKTLGQTRLRIYVDGETEASIDMEIYLGHGMAFNDPGAPWGIEQMGTLGHQGGVYNTYKIPFGKSIRITGQLSDMETEDKPLFWWIIRGTENLPVKIADVQLPDEARLKLYTRENYLAKRLEEFDLCKTDKAGALYQVTLAAKSSNPNYLEACMRAYVNGSTDPLWLSSGLEDYFLGTYYFQTGKYHTPIGGLTHFDKDNNSVCAYRFHDNDPVFFQDGFRMTCRVGEKMGEKIFHDPQETTYWTYTWVYEW
jgi:hypothetical protein